MKGLLLISGGIDSPVAGYLMLKKNIELVAIHFDNQPFTDDKHVIKAKELVKKLSSISGKKIKMYLINHGLNQKEFITNCNRRYGCVLCRRMMFRIAEKIALKENCDFLVTGENLSQVASQTLDNLVTTDSAVEISILRPLLCNDKEETIKISKEIGLFETSILPGICCNAVPQNPATTSTVELLEEEESKLNISEMVANAVKAASFAEY